MVCLYIQHCNFNWIFVIITWFNSILGHVVVFGGNTPTPSTYEILNMENFEDWMQTNLTLNDQAKESINSLKTIQTSIRLILQKISVWGRSFLWFILTKQVLVKVKHLNPAAYRVSRYWSPGPFYTSPPHHIRGWQIIFKNFGLFSIFNIFFGSDSELVTSWSHGRWLYWTQHSCPALCLWVSGWKRNKHWNKSSHRQPKLNF